MRFLEYQNSKRILSKKTSDKTKILILSKYEYGIRVKNDI